MLLNFICYCSQPIKLLPYSLKSLLSSHRSHGSHVPDSNKSKQSLAYRVKHANTVGFDRVSLPCQIRRFFVSSVIFRFKRLAKAKRKKGHSYAMAGWLGRHISVTHGCQVLLEKYEKNRSLFRTARSSRLMVSCIYDSDGHI